MQQGVSGVGVGMKVLVYLPIDAFVKRWAHRLEADGHEVESTFTFSIFTRRLRWADCTLVNATKHDAPRYLWKLLLSLLWARLLRRPVALCVSIDLLDLCDRRPLRALLWVVNWIAFHCPRLVILLATRKHMARRYGLPERRVVFIRNCPDRVKFQPLERSPERVGDRPLTFLYHGELLWWHGLERFLAIYEEIKKRQPARLIVTGNFYPTAFRVLGLAASRREIVVKRQLAALLERDDVHYRGRVSIDDLRWHMAEADFHVSLLNNDNVQARTELRTCLLEAMAAGMACLHAPTPAIATPLFRDGENIVLVDPGDPVACAEKILQLARAPERLDAIRRNAVRTITEHFDIDAEYARVLTRLEQIQQS